MFAVVSRNLPFKFCNLPCSVLFFIIAKITKYHDNYYPSPFESHHNQLLACDSTCCSCLQCTYCWELVAMHTLDTAFSVLLNLDLKFPELLLNAWTNSVNTYHFISQCEQETVE